MQYAHKYIYIHRNIHIDVKQKSSTVKTFVSKLKLAKPVPISNDNLC